MNEFKLLVCGGRHFGWKELPTRQPVPDMENLKILAKELSKIHQSVKNLHMELVIIHGDEKNGADNWASKWATDNDVKQIPFPADWKTHGKAGGPIRNKQMLVDGQPNLMLATPGGKGTKNMVEQAQKFNVPVKFLEV